MTGGSFNSQYTAIDTVLSRLESVKKIGTGHLARCPAHEDSHPSLSIAVGDDHKVLLRCFAGCEPQAIVSAIGLRMADLFPDGEHGSTAKRRRFIVRTTRYEVRGLDGQVEAVHVRKDFDDGSKDPWWERPDGQRGLGGRPVGSLPLYGIHELGDAASVVLTEGEKARDALASAGVSALGTVTGAGGTPDDEALKPLLARDIYLWPDNDADGERHMQRIAERLCALGQPPETIRRVAWAQSPIKGDAADFLAGGATAEGVRRMLRAAPEWEKVSAAPSGGVPAERNLAFRTARETAEATPDQPEWLAFGYVAAGGVTEIDGKIKGGKTTLIMALIAAVREGRPFLGKPTTRTAVVYLTEQGPASFRETLRRAGLLEADDVHILYWADAQGVPWPDIVAAARLKAQDAGAGLLVVDTLAHWAGLRGDAENNAGAALEAVGPLLAAASDGFGVVVLRHERKSGGDVGDSARGSSAFGGAVDIVVQIRRPEGNGRPTLRVLSALSRFDETPGELVVELTEDGEYITHGDGTAVAHAEALAAITKAAPESEAAAMTEKDLLATAGTKRTLGQAAIRELLADTKLSRTGEGKRGDPFRYWRAGTTEKLSAASSFLRAAESDGTANEHPESFLPEPPVVAAESNGHHPDEAAALTVAVQNILALNSAELADYRAELADVPDDDPDIDLERAALARADRMLAEQEAVS